MRNPKHPNHPAPRKQPACHIARAKPAHTSLPCHRQASRATSQLTRTIARHHSYAARPHYRGMAAKLPGVLLACRTLHDRAAHLLDNLKQIRRKFASNPCP